MLHALVLVVTTYRKCVNITSLIKKVFGIQPRKKTQSHPGLLQRILIHCSSVLVFLFYLKFNAIAPCTVLC